MYPDMHELVIRSASIALPDGSVMEGDLACDGGAISSIAPQVSREGREEIDAQGKLLMPGVIDPQVHFREPGAPTRKIWVLGHAPQSVEV